MGQEKGRALIWIEEETEAFWNVYRQAEKLWKTYGQQHGVACPRGCDRCCHQFFPMWPGEEAILIDGLSGLDPAIIREILPVAKAHADTQAHIWRELELPEKISVLPDEEQEDAASHYIVLLGEVDTPCVLLKDGFCRVYENRPLLCRLYGYPTASNPSNLCDILMESYLSQKKAMPVVVAKVFDPIAGAPLVISMRFHERTYYDFRTVAQVIVDFAEEQNIITSDIP
jgi:Fe-S-cluster containining protein